MLNMAWVLRAELEGALGNLSERLDVLKSRRLLQASTNVYSAFVNEPDYRHYVENGKSELLSIIAKTIPGVDHYLSAYVRSAVCACIVDEVNLAHIASLLRLEELLEGYVCDLPLRMQADILLAIIGEVKSVKLSLVDADQSTEALEFRKFVETTLNNLLCLIVESGRDRATYVKEAVVCPPITPPRPSTAAGVERWKRDLLIDSENIFKLSDVLSKDFQDLTPGGEYANAISAAYKRGDSQLEALMKGGSLLSIRDRLLTIFSNKSQSAIESIRWSLFRQLPKLNRARQLVFTRVLQHFATPVWKYSTYNSSKLKEFDTNNKYEAVQRKELLTVLVDAFIQSGVRIWCYEDETQKFDLLRSGAFSMSAARCLLSILCTKVNRGMTELKIDDTMPDMETLTTMFAEWKSPEETKYYEQFHITDMNICKKLPDDYETGYSKVAVDTILMGPRFHLGVPDICPSGELRFFTNPIVTALMDTNEFAKTMDCFMAKQSKSHADETVP